MYVDIEKITQVISYLLQHTSEKTMNYTKVLKLVFFADKLHLRLYGNLITNDTYCAMKYWPVASHTYDIIKNPEDIDFQWKKIPFSKINNYDIKLDSNIDEFDMLSETEKKILDLILKTFWNENWKDLVEDTHKYKEWADVYNEQNQRAKMDITKFFENSVWQNEIFNDSDENLEIVKNLYLERASYAI